MRCRRCQRSISGIGRPAIPPAVPALVAFGGGLAGLWSLTLGQDPSNALPHWSPVSGWMLGLGSLALASALAWIGLVRRKCPDCGSSEMLDGMEEEALIASERLAAQSEAAQAARAGLQSSQDKQVAESLATQEQALRSAIEQELRGRLTRELVPRIELDLRARLEKELHLSAGNETGRGGDAGPRPGETNRGRDFHADGPRAAARPSAPQARVETAPLSMRDSARKDRRRQ